MKDKSVKLIHGGLVYDGLGGKPSKMDISIENGEICETGQINPERFEPNEVINATGKIVTPGFIDIHRHCDIAALCDQSFGEVELMQGITSAVTGNCGLAPVPCSSHNREALLRYIEPCLGYDDNLELSSFSDYFSALESKDLPINIGSLVALGAVKIAVKGFAKTKFTTAEMADAKALITDAMKAGALGLSMGLMYVPECYSSLDELSELASAIAAYDGVLATHIRGEGDYLTESIAEVIEIARRAEVPLHISHFKSTGIKNWGNKIHQAIELIEVARAAGQDISVDFYPYEGGSTTLQSLLPPSVLGASPKETISFLSGSKGKQKLKDEIYKQHDGWDNMVTGIGWDRIIISSVESEKNKIFLGLSVTEACKKVGISEPSDFVCDLLSEEKGNVAVILLSMSQEDIETVARLPYSMLISDSLYGGGDNPHPRLYGSFPKLIRDYVLERKTLSLENAIMKMTSMPAKRMGLKNRGLIERGNLADLLVFKPENLCDHASFEKPKQLSSGIDYAIISSNKTAKTVIENGKLTHQMVGQVIKRTE